MSNNTVLETQELTLVPQKQQISHTKLRQERNRFFFFGKIQERNSYYYYSLL